jgi:hypothetical protein
LVTLNSGLPSQSSSGAMFKVEIQTFGVTDPIETSLCDALITLRIQLSECFEPAVPRQVAGTRVPG